MACCFMFIFCFLFYGYYLTLIFLAVKTISEIFEILKIQLFLTRKTEAGTRPSLYFLIFFWFCFFIFLDDFRNFNFHLGHTTIFTLSFVKMRCFFDYRLHSWVALSRLEFAQPLSDNTLQWYPTSSLCNSTSKYSLKSFSDMAPCTT